ncbi:MAG: universal stress protein [Pseudomonadota bacterium]
MTRFHRILVPFDGSAASSRALDEAIALGEVSGSRLRIVHVMDELTWTNGFEPAVALMRDIVPRMREAGEKLLAGACARAAKKQVLAEGALIIGVTGRICELVASEATGWNADLIVVGTHARHGVDRLLMGSDAEQIVRHAPVPVLLVRTPQEKSSS